MNPSNYREVFREVVSGLIFSSDGKLLMGKKGEDKGGVYTDCWHIPGGGVDEGEDKITTLIRELKEETNLDITNAKVELIDDKGKGATVKTLKDTGEKVWCKMNFNVYRVKLDNNAKYIKLNPSDDLVELKWFSIDELQHVSVTPPSIELFRRLGYIK